MDKALKQRMVGASVLIALAVIILPMLLGGRPEADTQQTRKIELPAQPPVLSFETRRYPIGELDPVQAVKKDQSTSDEPVRQLPVPKAPYSIPVAAISNLAANSCPHWWLKSGRWLSTT